MVASSSGTVTTSYLIQDALGSTAAVTNEDGTVTTRIAYDAWGNLVNPADGTTKIDPTTVSSITTVGYTGQELITEANLVQMGARIYDPASGVFLNPDPTVSAPYDSRDWNQYAYVYDNPMSYVDPTGYSEADGGSPQPLCDPSTNCITVTAHYIPCPPGTIGNFEPYCMTLSRYAEMINNLFQMLTGYGEYSPFIDIPPIVKLPPAKPQTHKVEKLVANVKNQAKCFAKGFEQNKFLGQEELGPVEVLSSTSKAVIHLGATAGAYTTKGVSTVVSDLGVISSEPTPYADVAGFIAEDAIKGLDGMLEIGTIEDAADAVRTASLQLSDSSTCNLRN
ncbi:MAG: RHS repeat domain-containing protein [Minisyncoccia bacterium]